MTKSIYSRALSYYISRGNIKDPTDGISRDMYSIEILMEFMKIKFKNDLLAARFLINIYNKEQMLLQQVK